MIKEREQNNSATLKVMFRSSILSVFMMVVLTFAKKMIGILAVAKVGNDVK